MNLKKILLISLTIYSESFISPIFNKYRFQHQTHNKNIIYMNKYNINFNYNISNKTEYGNNNLNTKSYIEELDKKMTALNRLKKIKEIKYTNNQNKLEDIFNIDVNNSNNTKNMEYFSIENLKLYEQKLLNEKRRVEEQIEEENEKEINDKIDERKLELNKNKNNNDEAKRYFKTPIRKADFDKIFFNYMYIKTIYLSSTSDRYIFEFQDKTRYVYYIYNEYDLIKIKQLINLLKNIKLIIISNSYDIMDNIFGYLYCEKKENI